MDKRVRNSVDLSKIILMAFQFFAFSHTLGHELPRHLAGSAAEVPLKAAAPATRQRATIRLPSRMANAKLSSQDLMPVLDQAYRSAR